MTNLIINLIKLFPPELAHYLTINLLKLSFIYKHQIDNPILNQHLFGLDFSKLVNIFYMAIQNHYSNLVSI